MAVANRHFSILISKQVILTTMPHSKPVFKIVLLRIVNAFRLSTFNVRILSASSYGFTIIELMVAMGLFVIVVGIASGTFVNSLRTQRNIVGFMAANDNASLTLEQISREIRTGSAFLSAGSALNFTNYEHEQTHYALADGRILRNGTPLTAENVSVKYLSFILRGGAVGDGESTRVTIMMGVSSRGRLESFITRLQTTVSARILDG